MRLLPRLPRRWPAALAVALCFFVSAFGPCLTAAEVALETDQQKTLYALGLVMARQVTQFRLTDAELATVLAGMRDGALQQTPRVEMQEWGSKIQGMLDERLAVVGRQVEEEGRKFREAMAAEPQAVTAASGLIYFDRQVGSGPVPGRNATVRVNYHSTFPDGTVVDSTVEAERPATLRLGTVMSCFREGLQDMQVGGKRKLICPPELAYGESGRPPKVPPRATLVFDVELLEILPENATATSEVPAPESPPSASAPPHEP